MQCGRAEMMWSSNRRVWSHATTFLFKFVCFSRQSLQGNHSVIGRFRENRHFGEVPLVTKGRLEAFTDGVMAVIITIMVLELKVPHGSNFEALQPLVPVFLTYVLSFVNLGIYWNNHHHMLHATDRINGAILWANLHLLFWLSLVPFTTGWMGENHLEAVPTAVYGLVMLCAAVAYYILQTTIVRAQGPGSKLARAIGTDQKGKLSPVVYAVAIPLAFVPGRLSAALYIAVAVIWFVPDRRIERWLDRERA